MKNILLIVSAFFLISCAGESNQTSSEEAVDSSATEAVAAEEPVFVEFDYPVDSNYGAMLVMANTMIYPDDFKNFDTKNVYALFKGAEGYYLDQVKVEGKVLQQEESEDETIQVVCEHKDSCIFFLSGVNYLQKRKVESLDITDPILPAGRTIEFKLNGKTQKMVVNGIFRDGKETDNFNDMTSYRLMLFGEKDNTSVVDMLVAHDSFDDAAISLLFVGDIDGDGLLDYLLETSRKYSNSQPALYLSKPASSDNLIKIIDVAGSAGGC